MLASMSHSPALAPPSVQVAEIERRLQWRALSVFAFVGIMAGLAAVAVMSQIARPRILTGLADDADLRAAATLVHGRTLEETGALRFTSALLGEGGVNGEFAPIARLRARAAESLARRAKARHSGDARAWAALGALDLVQGDWRGAERSYRAALDRSPHYGEARLGLGVTLALRARSGPGPLRPRALELAAIAQFAAVPERDPAYAPALWNRAMLLYHVGRVEEARRWAAAYRVRDPSSVWAEALRRTPPLATAFE